MLKKFIYGALLTTTLAAGAGFFTSCKDSIEDLRIDLKSENEALADAIEKLKTSLAEQKTTCASEIARLEGLITTLSKADLNDTQKATVQQMIQTAINGLSTIYAKQSYVEELERRIADLEANAGACGCDLSEYLKKDALNDIAALNAISVYSQELQGLGQKYNEILALLGEDGLVAKLQQDVADLQTELGNLQTGMGNLQTEVGTLQTEVGTLQTELTNLQTLLTTLQTDLGNLRTDLTNLQTEVTNLQTTVGTLTTSVNNLTTRVGNLEAYFNGVSVTQFQEALANAAWVGTNKNALDKIISLKETLEKLDGENIDALNNFLENNKNGFTNLQNMYDTLFPEGEEWGETEKPSYLELVKRVEANEAEIAQLQTKIDGIFGRLNTMVTGLVLQASTNTITGSINTPFGVNSMVLMTYFGDLKTNLREFPTNGVGAEFDSKDGEGERAFIDWTAIPNAEITPLTDAILVNQDENGEASLGDLWFTVNPGTVEGLNVNNFSLVNSVEDASKVNLTGVTKDDETLLTFGYSRAGEGNGNGLYRAHASAPLNRLQDIKIHIEPGLVETLKEAYHNRTLTDVARVIKAVYGQLQDVCEANALRYRYDAVTGYDANGNEIKEEQKVYSNYGIAATAFKPLGFAALYGTSLRTLPHWRNIEIPKDKVNLNLGTFSVGNVDLTVNIELGEITIDPVDPDKMWVEYTYPDQFDQNGNPAHWATDKINISGQINDVIDNVQSSIDAWIKGTGAEDGLNDKIKTAIADAVNKAFNGEDGLIKNIENQVNDMMGSIQKKLYDLVNEINSNYLGKINRVGSYYQRLANRINNVLENPNHYLQAMMMYRTASGNFARLSDSEKQATVFSGDGEAIELWATNYCFETICPIYRKFVGVTKVTYTDGTNTEDLTTTLGAAANNHENLMGTAFTGERAQLALDIKGANKKGVYTYEIAYQGLDYTGHTSTNKYYIKVVRK